MTGAYLAVAGEEADPADWSRQTLPDLLPALKAQGFKAARLTIAPLGAGWTTTLPPTHYRSGAGPLEALAEAVEAVLGGHFDAVELRGEEPLKSGYSREERHRLMDIYTPFTIPEAYEELTRAFLERRGITEQAFRGIAEALFCNYLGTLQKAGCAFEPPDEKWYAPVTPLQRGVDCANPVMDYRAAVLVASGRAAENLAALGMSVARIAGVGFARLPVDGPAHAARVAAFDHLGAALTRAEKMAGVSVRDLAASPDTALELYTCYPVIPTAFLMTAGLAGDAAGVVEFLRTRAITLTGGMNLARAPWNLPALRGLARVAAALAGGEAAFGVVQGNGGVGYAQGVAILRRV